MRAISPLKLAGALEGRVSDEGHRPQMGAVVQLYDRQDRLIESKLTDGDGLFVFAGLVPDLYSVRVTLATFFPAIRNQIQVQAGKSHLLDVSLSGLFSSIRLMPATSHNEGLINDDWKWVLRSSSATRPVFRYLPQDPTAVAVATRRPPIFTDPRGLVSLSAGDLNAGGPAGEMGTAFAFASNVFGANEIEVAGNVGYGVSADSPSAAIRTTFSRAVGELSPEVAVTMRQLYVPRWDGSMAPGAGIGAPIAPLRSISISLSDKAQISDAMRLDYGVELDSISFIDHLHYFSPYARLTYSLGQQGEIDVAYTSGNARPELGRDSSLDPSVALQREVSTLSAVSPVTLRGQRAKVQRGENYEIGYSRKMGSRRIRVSAYRESVQDAALMLAGAEGTTFAGDLIPDLYTDSLLFDAGNYHTMGYTAALTQALGDNYQVTVTYGSVGVLAPRSNHLTTDSPDELRALIRPGQRDAFTTQVEGTIPRAGTHFVASYQIMDNHAATAGHLYSTDSQLPEPGLNFAIRQPVPAILGLPFRMEATVDLQNLLAEGYVPIAMADGRQLLLVHTPRSLRGGLNFRF